MVTPALNLGMGSVGQAGHWFDGPSGDSTPGHQGESSFGRVVGDSIPGHWGESGPWAACQ